MMEMEVTEQLVYCCNKYCFEDSVLSENDLQHQNVNVELEMISNSKVYADENHSWRWISNYQLCLLVSDIILVFGDSN